MSSLDDDDYYMAKIALPDNSRKAVDEKAQPMLAAVKRYVNRRMRITLTDGRVVVGTCICIDYQGNILMNNADELTTKTRPDGTLETLDSRNLGMIMVKPQHLAKCEAERREADPELAAQLLR
eukprot:CAMPEP_0173394552 /NCGR_PEP_ID=MMETSP1356-20130122/28106_1 /TAXON_ID=77927 ORGANISM="Hemiselmis virescens, Strain PCC157" /NCGR_SAMPLE_ID=MMETSP1356 /ASSEMBLY_ACC=CAM_ASM_000847 /LENGTH=122 /DNA_ID=CAMNT_0014352965 /DNA_START=26 /DNA_END=394 /DNA_ORIENTATION=-